MEPAINVTSADALTRPLRIGVVDADRADDVWPELVAHIRRAVDEGRGEADESTLLDEVRSGVTRCMVIHTDRHEICGVVLAGRVAYPTGKVVLRVTHAACTAPSDQWLPQLVALLDEGARVNGATEIEMRGRAGFARLLRAYMEPSYIVMSRTVPAASDWLT